MIGEEQPYFVFFWEFLLIEMAVTRKTRILAERELH